MFTLCDFAAAFPSVSRRWLYTVLELLGMPRPAIRVIEAVNGGRVVLLNMGGVVTASLTLHKAARFLESCSCAARPIGRRLHETLARSKPGMVHQCADDQPVLLHTARLLWSLAPAFAAAGRFASVETGEVLVGSRRGERETADAQRVFMGVFED